MSSDFYEYQFQSHYKNQMKKKIIMTPYFPNGVSYLIFCQLWCPAPAFDFHKNLMTKKKQLTKAMPFSYQNIKI